MQRSEAAGMKERLLLSAQRREYAGAGVRIRQEPLLFSLQPPFPISDETHFARAD
jgi:hypothetical protein